MYATPSQRRAFLRVALFGGVFGTARAALSTTPAAATSNAALEALAPPIVDGGAPSAGITQIQVKRGTVAEWAATDPVLEAGEPGFETDTGKFKLGDGSSNWSMLGYFLNETGLSTDYGRRLSLSSLPTPYTIGHQGTSDVYATHTPESYRYCWNAGLRVLDLDARVLADGMLANIHGSTVDNFTNSTGDVATYSAMDFPTLTVNAGNVMGANGYPNSRPMLISEVMQLYGDKAYYNVEAKDGTGGTVQKIVDLATSLGLQRQVVVQSVNLQSLSPAVSAGMKTQHITNSPDVNAIKTAGVTGVCLLSSTASATISSCVSAGLLTWVYGVHRRSEHAAMAALGVQGIMSDNPVYSSTTTPVTTRDLFVRQVWLAGHITAVNSRGNMTSAGELQFATGQNASALAGFLCPLTASSYTLNLAITFDGLGNASSYGGVHICEPDDTVYKDNISGGGYTNGYRVQVQPNGTLQIVKTNTDGTSSSLGAVGIAVPTIGTAVALQIVVTPTQVIASIPAQSKTLRVTDSSYRGGYVHLLQAGLGGATQTRLSGITVV